MTAPSATIVDVDFINPFIDATLKTIEIQCSLSAQAGKAFIKGSVVQDRIDIAAVIALTSSAFSGSVAICFPKQVFLGLMTRMLGETYSEITADVQDGASELLNITFGQAKVILNEKGYELQKAIPTIVLGENISVKHMTRTATIVLPFESDLGKFYIEVATTLPGGNDSN
jgi:chemotaxis protein CheX